MFVAAYHDSIIRGIISSNTINTWPSIYDTASKLLVKIVTVVYNLQSAFSELFELKVPTDTFTLHYKVFVEEEFVIFIELV